ncbi:MAG: type II toxin-antitoxin system VapC family toxin [Nitrospirota bacterium]|nr:type II toxin-antitoxin system VapC family toxin [Nitrospirota bacterium]
MILYLDTSALVKLYVEEPWSPELTVAVAESEAVATSLIAYAESRAAFARARREARLSTQIYRRIVEAFVEDWPRYISIEVTDRIVKDAGDLAASRALRGYDALHLASALSLSQQVTASVTFLAFDRALSLAAKREALSLHPLGS